MITEGVCLPPPLFSQVSNTKAMIPYHVTLLLLLTEYALTHVEEGTPSCGVGPCHWMLPVATVRPCNN